MSNVCKPRGINDPDWDYKECREHGDYPADYLFCPGCEAVDRDIDEAIEREAEREANDGC